MKNYRIVPNVYGEYSIEKRYLFFFWETLYGSYLTVRAAEKVIEHLVQKV